mmetsp:Transcript_4519/g.13416  ORF Transcript_4519/g.13416 Transcript_4519/m.13416 type:complete len:206 (+) Transcript_4519:268-885(+)
MSPHPRSPPRSSSISFMNASLSRPKGSTKDWFMSSSFFSIASSAVSTRPSMSNHDMELLECTAVLSDTAEDVVADDIGGAGGRPSSCALLFGGLRTSSSTRGSLSSSPPQGEGQGGGQGGACCCSMVVPVIRVVSVSPYSCALSLVVGINGSTPHPKQTLAAQGQLARPHANCKDNNGTTPSSDVTPSKVAERYGLFWSKKRSRT